MTEIPLHLPKNELFDFLIKNKSILEHQKKYQIKHGDGVPWSNMLFSDDGTKFKAEVPTKADEIMVRAIINTTNLMDSHYDVHIPGLWKKSLKETAKMLLHLQEHQMAFDKIISDEKDLKAYTQTYSWRDLGFKFEGETEALVFDSVVKRDRNPFMFEQYLKKRVKNHSVGMRYVKIVMAINDEAHGAEFEAWEKYFPMIANKEVAEEYGFFWAVKEAKAIEGSAVPRGANYATPTLEPKAEPSQDTPKTEPLKSTRISVKQMLEYYHI